MGLDSIELLMEIEKFFRIHIPDSEAEKILTVQDMVNIVAQELNVFSNETTLRDQMFLKITNCISEINSRIINLKLGDLISNFLSPSDKENWNKFINLLAIDVPKPEVINANSAKLSDKIKSLINWKPNYDWQEITLEQFTNVVCASNYEKLLVPNTIKSKYEIYVGVFGITVDKIGVDYYEISPNKSFTSDLGVD